MTTPEKIIRMSHLNPADPSTPGTRFSLCGETYPNRNYSIRRPASNTACIEYIVSGRGQITLDGKTYEAAAGDTYFLPECHDQYYCADRNDPWEKIWVNFSGETAEMLARTWKIDTNPVYSGLDTSDLLQKFQQEAVSKDLPNAAEHCQALLAQLFCRMSAFRTGGTYYGAEELSPAEKMIRYIDRNAAGTITVEHLAAICGKSPSQAERIFQRATGMSVYRYALQQKISLAKQLLTGTGMSVQDIAAYLSFNDPFYFSGLFRKKVGTSPSIYRENAGKTDPQNTEMTENEGKSSKK